MKVELTDDRAAIGMSVIIQEVQKSAPLNGAIATIVAIKEVDHANAYEVEVYGARYGWFRAYDLLVEK